MVFIDGVFQAQDSYSVSGTTLTFSTAPANGRVITVYHAKAVSIGTPSDNSVDTVQLVDGAVTSAKLDTNIAVGGTLTVTGDANFDSNTLFVDASANAVGIGTSSPTTKLHLGGTAPLDSIIRQDSTVSGTNWEIGEREAGKWQIWEDDSDSVVATFTSTGNVGIGTASPASKLHVESGTAHNKLSITSTASGGTGYDAVIDLLGSASNSECAINMGINGDADREQIKTYQSDMVFRTNNVERMRIAANGTMGFGMQPLGANSGSAFFDGNVSSKDGFMTTGTNLQFLAPSATNTIFLRDNGNESMRIDASGHLLVGKSAAAITVQGTEIRSNGEFFSTIPSAFATLHVYSSTAQAYRFYVTHAGQIHATSTSISSLSDERLKENIVDLETGLSEVMALQPRRFDWKNGDKTNVAGFIAQEVETVLPDLIDGFKDESIEDAKGVRMGDMIPTLVKAIQEQQALIESLTARLETLENA
jgi:hypothetical protein